MVKDIVFTDKQLEFLAYGNRLYNIKSGATRSGKTFLDFFNIPKRLDDLKGKPGKIFILGSTKSTIQQNVIDPLIDLYGPSQVSRISSNNRAIICGHEVITIGASRDDAVNKIRGAEAKYIYGDEIATWSKEMFEMVKTRLNTPYSMLDATCNPENSEHWFKKFIDDNEGSEDLFYQKYTLWDGRLSSDPVEDMKLKERLARQFTGVYYDRYVLGEWVDAEGLVYEEFGKTYGQHIIDKSELPPLSEVIIGVDFGNNSSKHAFVATGFSSDYKEMYVLASKILETNITSNQLADSYVHFLLYVEKMYGVIVSDTFADSALQTHLRDMRASLESYRLTRTVRNSYKGKVIDRISIFNRMYNLGAVKFVDGETKEVTDALKLALWKEGGELKRLETVGTDVLDAFEYSYSSRMKYMI